MQTKDDLKKFVKEKLKDRAFVIVANREPYRHIKTIEGIKVTRPSGGVHSLLDMVIKATGGTYVAHGDGNADKLVVNDKGIIKMPPREKSYSLKRVFLTKEEVENYYFGFANQTLWPLFHVAFVKPEFNASWWNSYVEVNKKFAKATLEAVGQKKAFVWVNDYHLALLPRLLKESGRDLIIGTFWHIPWPANNIFRINPWGWDLLNGLLGSDYLAFHRDFFTLNFFQCVQTTLEAKVDSDRSRVIFKDHVTKVGSSPAGADYQGMTEAAAKNKVTREALIKKELETKIKYLAIGIDRVDYIKGLMERFKMIDRFLEKYPKFIGEFSYLGIMPISRYHIPSVRDYGERLFDLVDKINWKYSKNGWRPIYLALRSISRQKLIAYYKNADLCLVTSLEDGMNLVAKEYVIACEEKRGVLVLSKFTGAANDIRYCLQINPYNIEEGADAIATALIMSEAEKKERNLKMREELSRNNIYDWAINFIDKTLTD